MSCRHIIIAREWVSKEMSFMTVAPVVVKPLMLSKSALTGYATAPFPASTYGNAPKTVASSQVSATTRNASGTGSGSDSSCRIESPNPAVATILTTNTQRSSPP